VLLPSTRGASGRLVVASDVLCQVKRSSQMIAEFSSVQLTSKTDATQRLRNSAAHAQICCRARRQSDLFICASFQAKTCPDCFSHPAQARRLDCWLRPRVETLIGLEQFFPSARPRAAPEMR
jgi:hypothetical protein